MPAVKIDLDYVRRLAGQHAAQNHTSLANILRSLADEVAEQRACLYEMTATEVDEYDPRIGYIEVQVDPDTWQRALVLAGKAS